MPALNQDGTLGSLMSSPVQTLEAGTTALEALQIAKRAGVHHFPVIEGQSMLGLVCTCDLEDVELSAAVRTAIRRSPVALDEHARARDALSRMRDELVGSVLVMRDGRAIGIVTREDLCRAGLDASDVSNFHCDSCGAVTHLKREGDKGVLCLECRSRSNPESRDDETGVVD
jgi:predicted transcriptional regulator